MKKTLIGAISVLLIILFMLIFLVKGIPEFNTEYTKEFSYQKFSKVEKGMKREQVKRILGEPFLIWKPGHECWRYSRGTGKYDVLYFGGYVSVQVCFKDDKVIDTPRTVF